MTERAQIEAWIAVAEVGPDPEAMLERLMIRHGAELAPGTLSDMLVRLALGEAARPYLEEGPGDLWSPHPA